MVRVQQMAFEDKSSQLQVVVGEEPLKRMFRLCAKDRSRETGGILIGAYSSDGATARITTATGPPTDSESGPDWFVRGIGGLEETLRVQWSEIPRRYYIGEWHFHTARVPWPSQQDIAQMRDISQDYRYRCSTPLLLIVCPVQETQWRVKCYLLLAGSPKELPAVENNT